MLGFPSERRHRLFVSFLRGLNCPLVAENGAIVSQISTISQKTSSIHKPLGAAVRLDVARPAPNVEVRAARAAPHLESGDERVAMKWAFALLDASKKENFFV